MHPVTKLDSRTALLDAAEVLLINRGHAAITVRVVAAEAGVNHGLVRYYFGSLDGLLLAALERVTERLFERQRTMYAGDEPFIDKWRRAMRYLTEDDHTSGYGKLWMELQALSWNRPALRKPLVAVNEGWRRILTETFGEAMDRYGVDTDRYPVGAMVSLVMTFNLGIQLEQIGGADSGHAALLEMIDNQLVAWEEASRK